MIVPLLLLVILVVVVVVVSRRAGTHGGRPADGHTVREFFQYLLLFGLLLSKQASRVSNVADAGRNREGSQGVDVAAGSSSYVFPPRPVDAEEVERLRSLLRYCMIICFNENYIA